MHPEEVGIIPIFPTNSMYEVRQSTLNFSVLDEHMYLIKLCSNIYVHYLKLYIITMVPATHKAVSVFFSITWNLTKVRAIWTHSCGVKREQMNLLAKTVSQII